MNRTALETDRATRAAFVIVAIPLARPELLDRFFRTRRKALVALKAVAAREAALRLVCCLRFGQPGDDFREPGGAFAGGQPRLLAALGSAIESGRLRVSRDGLVTVV